MDNDISKRTVLVLLILTLVVSVVGTWTILSMPKTVHKTLEIGPYPDGIFYSPASELHYEHMHFTSVTELRI